MRKVAGENSSLARSRKGKHRFCGHQLTALCHLPILVLVVVASLDNADKQLLASSFPVLERTLDLDVETLGTFSMFTNLSYALSLPLWGYLVHRYGLTNVHWLLSLACLTWGIATMGIAWFGNSLVWQAIFRSIVGVALGSILPLSQTLLVECVIPEMRGRAFGWMGLCEKLAGTFAAASVVYFDDAKWTLPYYALGMLSLGMAVLARYFLHPSHLVHLPIDIHEMNSKKESRDIVEIRHGQSNDTKAAESKLSLRQISRRIVSMPPFLCLVAQGIFGGTPWDMMSFLLLLMDWRGFTKSQIVTLQFTSGLTSTIGGWLGGTLGDYFAPPVRSDSNTPGTKKMHGRIVVALVSVIGGIPLYGLFLFSQNYFWALVWINAFQLWANWVPAGALRPICADLTRNPSERAQIVSLWIVLEKTSGAIFGAPLVGHLTKKMVKAGDHDVDTEEKTHALAWNLFALSTLFWSICAVFWMGMALSWDKQISARQAGTGTMERRRREDTTELKVLI